MYPLSDPAQTPTTGKRTGEAEKKAEEKKALEEKKTGEEDKEQEETKREETEEKERKEKEEKEQKEQEEKKRKEKEEKEKEERERKEKEEKEQKEQEEMKAAADHEEKQRKAEPERHKFKFGFTGPAETVGGSGGWKLFSAVDETTALTISQGGKTITLGPNTAFWTSLSNGQFKLSSQALFFAQDEHKKMQGGVRPPCHGQCNRRSNGLLDHT